MEAVERRVRPLRSARHRGRAAATPSSFADLLAAAQAGGEWALSALYRAHDPAIRRYLRARAGQEGDDVASQTWLDVARNLHSFSGDEDAFRGWVFTIARRRLIDRGRRRSRRKEQPAGLEVAEPTTAPAHDPAELTAAAIDGEAAARRIVELLPADQAEIVLLRVVGGLDVAAVAELTGKRPGTVRVAQHRALKRLAAELDVDLA